MPAERLRASKACAKLCKKGASRTDRSVNASAHDAQKNSWRVQRGTTQAKAAVTQNQLCNTGGGRWERGTLFSTKQCA